jgi:ferredoxin
LTKIYYFSGTGNTLWSAKKIAESLGSECELINIGAEARKDQTTLEADAVILLFPSYAYGAPVAVQRFVKRAMVKAPYLALFVSFGTSPGGTLAQICRIFKREKIAVSYCGRIPAVENYIAIFGPQKEKTIQRRLALQKNATDDAALCIKVRKANRINTFRPLSALVSTLFALGVKIFYKCYRVSPDCDGCGICEKLCPVSAITMQDGRPFFSKECEHCQGCLNWCPLRAIHFGRINSKTPGYHHPEIDLADISTGGIKTPPISR